MRKCQCMHAYIYICICDVNNRIKYEWFFNLTSSLNVANEFLAKTVCLVVKTCVYVYLTQPTQQNHCHGIVYKCTVVLPTTLTVVLKKNVYSECGCQLITQMKIDHKLSDSESQVIILIL